MGQTMKTRYTSVKLDNKIRSDSVKSGKTMKTKYHSVKLGKIR